MVFLSGGKLINYLTKITILRVDLKVAINCSELKKKKLDLLLVFLLLAVSGNPAVDDIANKYIVLILFSLFLAKFIFFQKDKYFSRYFIVISTIFGIIFLLQTIMFSFFPVATIAGFYFRLFIGFAVVNTVIDFPRTYVKIMYYLVILSLIFYIPDQIEQALGSSFIRAIFVPLRDIIGQPESFRQVIGLHTFSINTPHRNAGMFWEPGAFAGFLTLAIVFLAMIKKDLSRSYYLKSLFVLSIGLFTTMSTTGYIAYPFALLLHVELGNRSKGHSIPKSIVVLYIIIPLLLVGSMYAFTKLDFLHNKIQHQTLNVKEKKGRWQQNRFGTILFDWKYIQRRPFVGWGPNPKTRYSLDPYLSRTIISGMGNGMTDFTAKFGLIGMMTFFISLFLGIMHLSEESIVKSLLTLLIIAILLQGECYLGAPLFLGLMFLEKYKITGKLFNAIVIRDKLYRISW